MVGAPHALAPPTRVAQIVTSLSSSAVPSSRRLADVIATVAGRVDVDSAGRARPPAPSPPVLGTQPNRQTQAPRTTGQRNEQPTPRNPRIARVLADLNFGQELGEGIKRMYEEMRLAGLEPPRYQQSSAAVHVELSGDAVDHRLDAMLPYETREVVAALRTTERLSTSELARAMGLSRPAALRRLNTLRDTGVVQWVGKSPKDPRAYWALATYSNDSNDSNDDR